MDLFERRGKGGYYPPLVEFIDSEGDCWLWTGALKPNGYGHSDSFGSRWFAHRLVWTILVGPIPEGLQLDHLCRVRNCVNPDHLEPVTPWENGKRGRSVPALNARKTHCKRGHEFTPENTYVWPKHPTGRYCRECLRLRERARYYAKKARFEQDAL